MNCGSQSGELTDLTKNFQDVCILRLPACPPGQFNCRLKEVGNVIAQVALSFGKRQRLLRLAR